MLKSPEKKLKKFGENVFFPLFNKSSIATLVASTDFQMQAMVSTQRKQSIPQKALRLEEKNLRNEFVCFIVETVFHSNVFFPNCALLRGFCAEVFCAFPLSDGLIISRIYRLKFKNRKPKMFFGFL